ncbi:ornithine carbamoyltransferase [Leucobacter sp. cx-328]|uniref:ornithine carbamoyltransferase n=1 Tax=unclassified Leucobacter TaxID=2621730 RepID=UPI00165E54DA|nr:MULTISPECIES: ornithine carbamoyltransferase [unclassified Leucobacter]MBC9945051.1 ornithine carbamoyltransferase [Leucobacter sp. cx-328]
MIRHMLRDDDLTHAEQLEVLDLAARLKRDRFAERPLENGKTVAVIFDKTSTRTRISFAVGVSDMGGYPLLMDSQSSQLGGKESIEDTSKVMSRMVETIVWRTFAQTNVVEMAEHATVPVINALTDDFHPCQILADLQTIREQKGELRGLTATYLGDAANNMGHSYLLGFATAGMNIRVACPEGYQPREDIVEDAKRIAATTGGSVEIFTDAAASVQGADVVITDTWVSMGQEAEKAERVATFGSYRVTGELMAQAKSDAIFMHCLPAYREYEVAPEVIDGPQSVVWDEAENRIHAQKALMVWLLAKSQAA